MNCVEIVDLSSDDELGEVDVKPVKLEPGTVVGSTTKQKNDHRFQPVELVKYKTQPGKQASEENKSSNNALSTGQSSTSFLEQGQSPGDDTGVSSTSAVSPAPVCRQFWKAGSYEGGLGSKVTLQNSKNYLHVHPLFLHSNATSHKWAFGAIAELLDNAIDEIQNGATFVIVDKTSNPRDGSPALLIQDDGGGMDPEAMRRCMSFGFSDKKSKSAIGQYGNGFKTSSMRLGGDVIVFSRYLDNRSLTQSIGLLSYTFLTRTGHDRIVVPMVDYELNVSTGMLDVLHGREHFVSNLSILLQWSPYSTEAELLKQFDDIGSHGTKIIIYNLWLNNDRDSELDFDSDPKDIRISGDTKKVNTIPAWKAVNEQHIASRYHISLRVYLSILYLRIPDTFRIILRGEIVEHHNIADDLKFIEYILYRPQSLGSVEGTVVCTIGFLKEAPQVNIHGFCVYHKNRLILPFWQVVSYSDSRGRGVVGVLEANFVEPTHNKQDFERTSLFQKLEGRLKEMTWEYWDYHCGLIGYQVKKKSRPAASHVSSHFTGQSSAEQPVLLNQTSLDADRAKTGCTDVGVKQSITNSHGRSMQGLPTKRKEPGDLANFEKVKRQAGTSANTVVQPVDTTANHSKDQETIYLMQENKKLRAKCSEYEKRREELNIKVEKLRSEVSEVQREYYRLLAELNSLDIVKDENDVYM
ncbi:PREDICTED: protein MICRORCHIDIA 6 isoform X1 [Theobroma cacao]|uniref:Protein MICRORCHIDIA 6 isoform X1 n=1 Tax=Theobroma cacao TaxID=3641 RepID=A0AB32VCS9_THECC|nr:PREDICTED: protein MICRORCHIDIA 6 isoform X2 [Theobroma cacao]XP_017973837.1 PREDICTED: protein MICRORCHIDIA 6 isoform X1 [Theobroma cacao]